MSRGKKTLGCYNYGMLEKFYVVLAVGAYIFDDKKRILLVKKSLNEKVDPGRFVVPGGKIDKDEFIYDGLKREVKEEVNLDVTSYQWVNENVFVSNGFYFHAEHFLCRVKSLKSIKLEKNLTEYAFVSKKDLDKYDIPKGLRETIDILL